MLTVSRVVSVLFSKEELPKFAVLQSVSISGEIFKKSAMGHHSYTLFCPVSHPGPEVFSALLNTSTEKNETSESEDG